jgi:hypothetical protein
MSSNALFSANDGNVIVEGSLSTLQISSVMLFWPIHFHHFKNCVDCLLTPISPAFNLRDICDSRLHDNVNPHYRVPRNSGEESSK